jgi:hypothetical protein
MNKPFFILLFFYSFILYSCGEYFEFDTQQPTDATQMSLGRHVITLVEGDQFKLPVAWAPEQPSNTSVHWLVEESDVATMRGDTVVARQAGVTRTIAYTAYEGMRDSCVINVLPPLKYAIGTYPYDQVFYARVTVDGQQLTTSNDQSVVIAAFVGDEVRGVAYTTFTQRDGKTVEYTVLRVWSPFPNGDEIHIACYSPKQARLIELSHTETFDGESHGTTRNLYPMDFDGDSKEYLPSVGNSNFGYFEDPTPVVVSLIDNEPIIIN